MLHDAIVKTYILLYFLHNIIKSKWLHINYSKVPPINYRVADTAVNNNFNGRYYAWTISFAVISFIIFLLLLQPFCAFFFDLLLNHNETLLTAWWTKYLYEKRKELASHIEYKYKRWNNVIKMHHTPHVVYSNVTCVYVQQTALYNITTY